VLYTSVAPLLGVAGILVLVLDIGIGCRVLVCWFAGLLVCWFAGLLDLF
jgi:hypothetical protein